MSKAFNVLHILWYPISIIGPTMAGPGTVLKREFVGRLENATLKMVFTNNKAVLLIFK